MSSIYNAYIAGPGPYEKIPEAQPSGSERSDTAHRGKSPGLSGIFSQLGLGQLGLGNKLSLNKLDSGDLLLLLILFLLLKEGEETDTLLLLALAAAFLLPGDT